jgi:hypothetical protein
MDSTKTLGLTAPWGSIRQQVVIACEARQAWERIANLGDLASWFTDIGSAEMDTDAVTGRPTRWVTMPTGARLEEEIVLVDGVARRFQYRLKPVNFITHHLATIDVIEVPGLGTESSPACLVVYSTDLGPRSLALAFASGTSRALASLKSQLENDR